jgi:hypothetical protein
LPRSLWRARDERVDGSATGLGEPHRTDGISADEDASVALNGRVEDDVEPGWQRRRRQWHGASANAAGAASSRLDPRGRPRSALDGDETSDIRIAIEPLL